ncbi:MULTISPECIES: GNAT family N-acetyltransferase [Mesorhizobium]|uniref:N-acetyltransferase n=1 Tax=Mesorhizobium denitrificans TaxID=2294114 RepID=A0A371XHZ9_9HYPH|nr:MULTISPECIES: GNAT family protein [Mesorhizobium]RFC68839.1 N-acetyltransferase [Mesorhizobium denitrificans]
MFALPFFRRDLPVLVGERVRLRAPALGDFRQWTSLRSESRSFLEPWEPSWSPDELDYSAWRLRIGRYREDIAQGSGIPFFLFSTIGDKLYGGITLSNIRRGVAQTGSLGYWIGARYAGQGFMQEAVRLVVEHAFDGLRLHRVEAACIPTNTRSVRVLEKAGFQREGVARSYLKINGVWQDHSLYAIVANDLTPAKKKG